jgi:nucleoside-diphosphate-sugar epimerase
MTMNDYSRGAGMRAGKSRLRRFTSPHRWAFFRPADAGQLLGDASKARRILGWKHTVAFPEPVSDMLNSDLKVIARESYVGGIGHD